jgi:phage N-6-adenine-methyltransferase
MDNDLMFSTGNDEWETPQALFDRLNAIYNFTLDVCATPENAKCKRYFTQADDGLKQDWSKEICWMNPPYSKPESPCKSRCKKKACVTRGYHISKYKPGQEDWIRKAYEESLKGTLVVALLPVRTDTEAFHRYIYKKQDVDFIKGRLKFGKCEDAAPFPSMIVVFKKSVAA